MGGNFNKMIHYFYKIANSEIRRGGGAFKSFVALIICLSFAANSGCRKSRPEMIGNAVAQVNGEEISLREFKRSLHQNREIVASQLREKYGTEDETDFWKNSDDKASTLNILKEKSLNDCVRFKIEQLAAKEKGLISDTGYEKFSTAFNEENERRKKALERGEVIYGPKQYNEEFYYDYLFGAAIRNLKEKLSREAFDVSEQNLESYYETHKAERYRRKDTVKIQIISIDYSGGKGESARIARDKARETMAEIRQRVGVDANFFESAEKFANRITVSEKTLNPTRQNEGGEEQSQLEAKAARLNIGEMSEVFEENKAFHTVKCVGRIASGYFDFDEIREVVKSNYIDEQYRLFIDKKAQAAEVEINRKIYDGINFN